MKYSFILFLLILISTLTFSQFTKPVSGLYNSRKPIQSKSIWPHDNTFEAIAKKINKKPDFIADLTANKVDSAISISSYDTLLLRFTYNNSGNVTAYFMDQRENGSWKNSDRFYYTYGSNGKKSLQSHEYWEDNSWKNDEKYTYTYDSNGNLLNELLEKGGLSGWEFSEQVTYTYNNMNLKTLSVAQKWNGTGWDNVDRVLFQYNTAGQKTVERYESWNGSWKPTSESSYSFTDWGDYSEILTTDYSNMGIKYRLSFEFNSSRQVITETNATLDGGWKITSKTSHSYQNNNTVHSYISQFRQNDSLVNSEMVVDTLYTDGRLLSSYLSAWKNESWVLRDKAYSTYNSAGKILTTTLDRYYSDTATMKIENIYDASGELLQSYHCSTWINGVPSNGGIFYFLEIDRAAECIIFLYCNDLYFWYKKVTIPVELAMFTASTKDGSVHLKWQTATETNNKGFEIERKTGNSNWIALGFVQGYGTTTENHNYSFIDKNSTSEKCYYRLKQIDFDGTVNYSSEIEVGSNVIKSYAIGQNYPNPFNPSTLISFSVPKESRVSLKIFNSVGQLVKELVNGVKAPGTYDVKFDASQLSSGIYFYSIEANATNGTGIFKNTKKMILVK